MFVKTDTPVELIGQLQFVYSHEYSDSFKQCLGMVTAARNDWYGTKNIRIIQISLQFLSLLLGIRGKETTVCFLLLRLRPLRNQRRGLLELKLCHRNDLPEEKRCCLVVAGIYLLEHGCTF